MPIYAHEKGHTIKQLCVIGFIYLKKENTNNILQKSEVYLAPPSAQNPGQLPTLITFKASRHFIHTDKMAASSKTKSAYCLY